VLVALAGAAAPLVHLRPNRIAPGTAEALASAGPAAWLVAAAVLVALAGAVWPRGRQRRAFALLAAPLLLVATAWALGGACTRLLAGAPPLARVSLATGAWVLLVAVAVLGLAAAHLEPPAPHARRLLLAAGVLAAAAALPWGGLGQLSLAREFADRAVTFWPLVQGHVALAGAALLAGTVLGTPLGLWAARSRRARGVVLGVTGAIQTVPSLALLGLLVVPLAALGAAFPVVRALGIRGIGAAPALIVLTLYVLLPVVRGTYVGLTSVDAAAVDAGRGMGMRRAQLLWRVELPLAAPLIVDGIRTASVLVIGITTLTAFAGARNLGVLVFEGLGQFAPDLILLGALPIVALAIAADAGFGWLARTLTPEGVRP
jgi:osmoprotectant transport system permease protein